MIRIYMGGLILGVNMLYMLFLKLFAMVGEELNKQNSRYNIYHTSGQKPVRANLRVYM